MTTRGEPAPLMVLVAVLIFCDSWLVLGLAQSLVVVAAENQPVGGVFWTAIAVTCACLLALLRWTQRRYIRLVGRAGNQPHGRGARHAATAWIEMLTAVTVVAGALFFIRDAVGFVPAVMGALAVALLWVLTARRLPSRRPVVNSHGG